MASDQREEREFPLPLPPPHDSAARPQPQPFCMSPATNPCALGITARGELPSRQPTAAMLPQRSPAFILTGSGTASDATPSITRRSSCTSAGTSSGTAGRACAREQPITTAHRGRCIPGRAGLAASTQQSITPINSPACLRHPAYVHRSVHLQQQLVVDLMGAGGGRKVKACITRLGARTEAEASMHSAVRSCRRHGARGPRPSKEPGPPAARPHQARQGARQHPSPAMHARSCAQTPAAALRTHLRHQAHRRLALRLHPCAPVQHRGLPGTKGRGQ